MNRREELVKVFKDIDESKKIVIIKLVDDMVFLEEELDKLRKLPLIKVHPTNPDLQKQTPAGKLYKELLPQYNNIVKTLCSILHKDDGGDESPLREYFKRIGQ